MRRIYRDREVYGVANVYHGGSDFEVVEEDCFFCPLRKGKNSGVGTYRWLEQENRKIFGSSGIIVYREKDCRRICMRIAFPVLRTKNAQIPCGKIHCRKIQSVCFRNTRMSRFPGMEMRREKCSPSAGKNAERYQSAASSGGDSFRRGTL